MGEEKTVDAFAQRKGKQVSQEQEKRMKAFIWGPMQMILSALFASLMVYYAKLATQTVPTTEVTFFRLALGVLVSLAMMRRCGYKLITEHARLLVLRGFFGGVTVLLFFLAIEKGTMTNSTVLQNTFPIFAVILSFYLFREKITVSSVFYMVITFIGILLLIRPDLGHVKTGDLLALASGVVGGYTVIAIRQLRQKGESVWTIFFYFCIFGAFLSLCLALPQWEWPVSDEYVLIGLTSLTGLISQVTMTSAYKYCTTLLGGILSMSSSVFSFVIGVLFLNEQVGLFDLAGIILIIMGSVLVVIDENANTRPKQKIPNQIF